MSFTARDVRSVADVRRLHDQGERPKYLYFWGHQPGKEGAVGSGCLSQWWPLHPFTVEGVDYRSAEHWMMAGKARLFGDDAMLSRILEANSPAEAKALGGKVQGFDEETWAAHRFEIVAEGNVAKFGQHDDLKTYLLGTGARVLVEASPRDRIWGIGLAATDERVSDPHKWRGLNLLGFALMEARARLSDVR
ncbi:NADAR family protein [Actinomadura rudentiformis]|uniref:NADAR family protein n=1 Tax=Actinomadura rudentiformis TaxID=359158 RepID=A0A6H9YXA0_9ACTN|nr:NADAR family protein [Actinomadura rudentiformis]KAB2345671.1 NADAR family protein [Actinomadura rudentiformis]